MKDKLDIKQVFLKINSLYRLAQYDDKNFIHEKYVWLVGIKVITTLKTNANMFLSESASDEQGIICGIPILGIDYYNTENIKLYKEIS